MKYGTCIRCLAEWQPKEYWNSKAMIYYKGCIICPTGLEGRNEG